jgi:hypothetical protein
MTTRTFLFLFAVFSALFFSSNSIAKDFSLKNQSQVKAIYNESLNNKSSNPWHITNLYSKEDDSFFIPYHLWSGSNWDGNKNSENCMHDVRNKWVFKRGDRERKNRVSAPMDYKMPESGKIVKTFQVENRRNTQNYVCHEKGLARIYDGRFDDAGVLSELDGKECKFPAGFGWRLDESQDCSDSSPKETKVVELIFDENFILKKMSYTYEKKEGRKTRRKNDYYEYEPDKGRTLHKKYK